MEWIPQTLAMDVGGVKGAAFKSFSVHRQVPTRDGLVQVEERIDSLHKLRQIERDSEQRFRNGEGEPMRFRMWNQDRSNKDVGSFGAEGRIGDRVYDSGQAPQKQSNISVARHGEKKPRRALGPGMKGAASPLRG